MATYTGTNGNDEMDVRDGDHVTANLVESLAGDDLVTVDGGETVYLGDGNDGAFVLGTTGDNLFFGEAGNDRFFRTPPSVSTWLGNNHFDGGEGFDVLGLVLITLSMAESYSVEIVGNSGTYSVLGGGAGNDTFSGIEFIGVETTLDSAGTISGSDLTEFLTVHVFAQTFAAASGVVEITLAADGDSFVLAGNYGGALSFSGMDLMQIYTQDDATGVFTFEAAQEWTATLYLSDWGDVDATLIGGGGTDYIRVNGGDTVYSGAGNDYININGGSNLVDGGSGFDIISLWVENGTNNLDGGEDTDLLIYDFRGAAGPVETEIAGSDGTYIATRGNGSTDTISSFDTIFYDGSEFFADTFKGSDLWEQIAGGGGNDYLDGGGGNDFLYCAGSSDMWGDYAAVVGKGDDTYLGGAGNDVAFYADESAANYKINVVVSQVDFEIQSSIVIEDLRTENKTGTDVIIGVEGVFFDDLYIFATTSDSTINLYESVTIQTPNGGVVMNFDNAIAGIGDDTVIGNDNDNSLGGEVGDDHLAGNLGDDELLGGGGNDILFAGAGNDMVDGGEGNDLIVGGDGAGDDTYYGGDGTDTIKYKSAIDEIVVNLATGSAQGTDIGVDALFNVENVTAGSGSDRLTGDGVDNTIKGGLGRDIVSGKGGADVLMGNKGGDILNGGGGNDVLKGKDGADTLKGGNGADTLSGGKGADSFVFNKALGSNNVDTLTDFNSDKDTIKLDDDVFTALASGSPHALSAEQFEANTTGLATDAEVRIIYNTGTGALYYDPDGSGSEQSIQFAMLTAAPSISPDDFQVVG